MRPPAVNPRAMYGAGGGEEHDDVSHDGGHVDDPPTPMQEV